MSLDEELDKLEQKEVQKDFDIEETFSSIKNHIEAAKSNATSKKMADAQVETNAKLDKFIENQEKETKSTKEVHVTNPVREVTVTNPQKEVTITNPEVSVKNIPSYKEAFHTVVDAIKGVKDAFPALKETITSGLKQIRGTVFVENEKLNVQLIDPTTGNPYKAGGSSLVATGGGGQSKLKTSCF